MGDITNFMDAMNEVASIKKVQTILPISRKTCNISALLVGDDMELRTSLISPSGYDTQMTDLLYKHSSFAGEDGQRVNIDKTQFTSAISNIDKHALFWGIYKASYDVLDSNRTISCTNTDCDYEIKKVEIQLDDIIHDDTYTIWDKDVPFYKYTYEISIPYQEVTFIFHSRLPSIGDNNRILALLGNQQVQENLRKLRSAFSLVERMVVNLRKIQINFVDGRTSETSDIGEMIMSIKQGIPHSVSEEFFTQYDKHFEKYQPKFYKKLECPKCMKDIKYEVDLETEFFRRSILGRRESE